MHRKTSYSYLKTTPILTKMVIKNSISHNQQKVLEEKLPYNFFPNVGLTRGMSKIFESRLVLLKILMM